MKKLIGIILIVAALVIGYDGVKKFDNSSASVSVLGITLNAENKGAKQTAFIEIGLAVVALLGGISLLRRTSGS